MMTLQLMATAPCVTDVYYVSLSIASTINKERKTKQLCRLYKMQTNLYNVFGGHCKSLIHFYCALSMHISLFEEVAKNRMNVNTRLQPDDIALYANMSM